MKETELKPCPNNEETQKQANRYLMHIFVEIGRFQTHNSFHHPTVIMSRDIFNILMVGTERVLYVNDEFQTMMLSPPPMLYQRARWNGCNLKSKR